MMNHELREKLAEFCLENELPQPQFDKLKDIVSADLTGVVKLHDNVRRELSDVNRKYENIQKVLKDTLNRQESKLRSVYYLLDTIVDAGTHAEKRIIIRSLKNVLENLIERDPLPLSEDLLPF